MPENWKTYKLEDLVTKLGDGIHGTPKYSKDGEYHFINGNNLIDGKIVIKPETKRVSKEEYLKHQRELNKRTLLVSINGTIGKTAYYRGEKVMLGKSACYFNVKESVNKKFIKQVISSKYFIDYLESNYTGSVIKNVSLKSMRELPINLPPLQEQKSIASILSALDDKIELNLKMNKTLEEMAMALYKHWFVNFGPFQSGEFVDSELGKIPKGWEVKILEDEFKITIGRTPPRKEKKWFSSENGVKWISIKDMGNCGTYIFKTSEYLTEEAVQKKNVPQVPANTVVLSFKLTVGRVALTTENMVTNEAIAHFLKKKNTLLSSEYLYSALKSFDYNSLGSTSSIATAVNSKTVKSMKILVPSKSVLDNFQQEVFSFFELIKTNSKEIQTLTKIRDTLLPKLISGEVRVKDAEKTLSEIL